MFRQMHQDQRMRRLFTLAACAALVLLGAAPARASSFVGRGLTLPRSAFELGLGAGIGRTDIPDSTGLGVNMELGYGISSNLELRLRTSLRFGYDGRVTEADYYARPVETETMHDLGSTSLSNPEIGLRFVLARSRTVDLGFDARIYLPLSGDLRMLLGVPLALRLGDRLRIDTGIFFPIYFNDPDTRVDVSVPLHFWFRLDSGTFLGPITGIYHHDGGGDSVPFGFGVGTSISYDAEVRFWLLFPDIDHDRGAKTFGAGVGIYVMF